MEPTVDDYVKTAIASMKREMDERGTADVAKFWLFMATDIIVELSFGESFGILKHGKVGGKFTSLLSLLTHMARRTSISKT